MNTVRIKLSPLTSKGENIRYDDFTVEVEIRDKFATAHLSGKVQIFSLHA